MSKRDWAFGGTNPKEQSSALIAEERESVLYGFGPDFEKKFVACCSVVFLESFLSFPTLEN